MEKHTRNEVCCSSISFLFFLSRFHWIFSHVLVYVAFVSCSLSFPCLPFVYGDGDGDDGGGRACRSHFGAGPGPGDGSQIDTPIAASNASRAQ